MRTCLLGGNATIYMLQSVGGVGVGDPKRNINQTPKLMKPI